jgi:hypothetical protein
LNKKSKDKVEENSMIPFTDIPIRHFKAMLKKDALLWIRSWRRMAFEIAFPMFVFFIIAAIRKFIPSQKENGTHLGYQTVSIGPFARPERVGIAGWKNDT